MELRPCCSRLHYFPCLRWTHFSEGDVDAAILVLFVALWAKRRLIHIEALLLKPYADTATWNDIRFSFTCECRRRPGFPR